jgi:hypothetical protein
MPIGAATTIGQALALTSILTASAVALACSGGDVATVLAALEPDFARPGPVALAPEAGAVLAWLDAPDDPAAADAALRSLARLYDLDLAEDGGTPVLAPGWEAQARSAITAIGIAIVAADGGTVRAAGAYWSTPLHERLRVVPVPEGTRAPDPSDLAPTLGPLVATCAVDVDEWVLLSEDLARDLLERTDELWMLAYGPPRDRGDERWATWVPDGRIEDALGFAHPGVPDRSDAGYSALFYGRGPGLVWAVRNAPRASTTLGPADLLGWVRSLFR